jgi:branched-chain amino acid transport system ATP-binding protein
MLEMHEVDAFYDSFQALSGVSLEVHDHEMIGLIGPNGHGKTTILNAISGLVPIKGSIVFDGKRIDKLAPHEIVEMGIIHVPQGAHLFPEMTVLENLKMGAYTVGAWKTKDESLRRVFELFPKLDSLKNRKCLTLSGGERQMTAIGRALMSLAKLLMLDEPSMGLAPKVSHELLRRIAEIKDSGISMILVEQNIVYAGELAERIYLIEKGKVALERSGKEVLQDKEVRKAYLGM